jgi:hypothetical protein
MLGYSDGGEAILNLRTGEVSRLPKAEALAFEWGAP